MSALATAPGLRITAGAGTTLLDDVHIRLTEGRVTALLGPSGAGKTTLAHALLGHLAPGLSRDGGTVTVAGHDPFAPAGRRALLGRVTGYLPQDPTSALDPHRTILAQLRTADRIARSTRDGRTARIRAAAEAAAFDERLWRRRIAQLSGGQGQRALLAWTFVTRPRLLLLDEPTSGLDAETARRVAGAFGELPWEPAVLLITHDDALVARVADEVIRLEAGRVASCDDQSVAMAPPAGRPNGDAGTVGDPVLAAEGLTIDRGELRLMDGASLALGAGELLALRGPSGSGKTALARALCGLAPPQAGSLRLRGAVVPWEAARRARRGAYVAYVGQDARAALNPHETVRRTLQRARQVAERRGEHDLHEPAELLDLLALPATVLDRRPAELSGGQRHRVALARALAAAPVALVCDETTASLDAATAGLVLDLLDRVRRETGVPVLLVTHQDAVVARADRVLTLAGGDLR